MCAMGVFLTAGLLLTAELLYSRTSSDGGTDLCNGTSGNGLLLTAGLLTMGIYDSGSSANGTVRESVTVPNGGSVLYGGTSCKIVPDSGTVTNSGTISDSVTAL
jgi:hypothetical protein